MKINYYFLNLDMHNNNNNNNNNSVKLLAE